MEEKKYVIPQELRRKVNLIPQNVAGRSKIFPIIRGYYASVDKFTTRHFEAAASDWLIAIGSSLKCHIVEPENSFDMSGRLFWHCAHTRKNSPGGEKFIFQYKSSEENVMGTVYVTDERMEALIAPGELKNKEIIWAHFIVFLDSFS